MTNSSILVPNAIIISRCFVNKCSNCRLWFTKETEETTLAEINRINGEFTTLTEYIHSDDVTFDFLPILSMLDNLIKNRLLGNRNQSLCPFCLGTMKQCMDPNFSPDPSPESLQLMCMSVLHYMLHCIDHIFKGKHTMKSNQGEYFRCLFNTNMFFQYYEPNEK